MSLHFIIYLLFVHVSLLIPGYVLIKKMGWLSKKPALELSFAYLSSMVFFAVLATFGYVLKFSPAISQFVGWAVILGSLILFIKQRYFNDLFKLRFPLICLVLMSLLSSTFATLTFNAPYTYIPDPAVQDDRNYAALNVKVLNIAQTQANDNYIPYRQAQFYVNHSDPAKDCFICEWGVHFFQRTPLMGAVTANYFTLFNDKPPIDYSWSISATDVDYTYAKFQLISDVLNSLFIVPAFFIIAKFFDPKTARISSLFLVSSQFFLFNSVFSWPKSLVAFFVLLSWLLLLEKKIKYTVLAGAAAGIGYLAHDLAVLYIGASVLLLIFNKRFREMFIFGLTSFLFAIPWLFISSVLYNKSSSFIYYPLSIGGIPQPENKKAIIEQFLHTSPLRILYIKLANLFYLLSPYQLLTSEGGQEPLRRLYGLGLYSVSGSIGVGMIIPAVLGAFKKLAGLNFWTLALTPIVLSTIVIGWPKGLGSLHFAQASVVLLTALGVAWLIKLKSSFWLLMVFAFHLIQLVFFIIYSYKFETGFWLNNPSDLFNLLIIIGVMSFCALGVYLVSTTSKTKHKLLKLVG